MAVEARQDGDAGWVGFGGGAGVGVVGVQGSGGGKCGGVLFKGYWFSYWFGVGTAIAVGRGGCSLLYSSSLFDQYPIRLLVLVVLLKNSPGNWRHRKLTSRRRKTDSRPARSRRSIQLLLV